MHSHEQEIIQLRLIYYIQEEHLDSEIVEKIIWNDQISLVLEQYQQDSPFNQLLGLYGTLETVKLFLSQNVSCRQTIEIYTDDQIETYSNRGILCIALHNDYLFLCFICPEQYFAQKVFQESAEITLYRYLKDLCQNIVLLPSEKIIVNWNHNLNHFYQEQDSMVMEYEISQIDEKKLETQKLMLELENESNLNLKLLNNQENLRCSSGTQIYIDNTQIKEEVIIDCFLSILHHRDFNIQTSNLEIYGPKVSKALYFCLEQTKSHLNQFFQNIFYDYKKEIKGSWYDIFKTYLKSNETILNIAGNICFKTFRQSLQIDGIGQIQYNQIYDQFDSQLQQQNLIFKSAHLDLNEIINQSQQYFKDKFYYPRQNNDSIPKIYKSFCQKINKEIETINNNPGIILQSQIYKFNAIRSLNTKEYLTKFDINNIEIDINNITEIEYPKYVTIHYFFKMKSANFFILKYEDNNNRIKYYLWIQNDVSEIKVIFRMNELNQLQFHYDNANSSLYIFNTKLGISIIQYNEDRKIIKSEKVVHLNDRYNFIDLAYLQFFESFILLNDKSQIYKWNIDSQTIQKIDLKSNLKFQRVLTSGTGNYYCLLDQNQLSIFNFNNEQIYQNKLEQCFDRQDIKMNEIHLFSDQQDWYFTLLQKDYNKTFQIKNLSNQQKIVSKNQIEENSKTSNPFLDLLKGSVIKYGPCFDIFLTGHHKTELYINSQTYDVISEYFDLLDLQSTDHLNEQNSFSKIIRNCYSLQFSDFLFALISRQAIQLCTIEKSLLIPLSKGLKQLQQNEIRILDKVNQLSFGIIEKILDQNQQSSHLSYLERDQNIFIVSIMGRQSSGKSYLLNRIFGTRFGVSSARCTDGIWMSVSKITDHTFILLDCEGLFSTRRTPEEETMLLAFLSSISDVTILNQDLTFSRNLNELFQNLSKTIQQIRGEKLFKGKLMIAVRDVNQKEKDAAQKELLRNIEQIKNNQHTGNFLTLLFNDNFLTMLMSYFDNKQFDKDIFQIRKVFLENAQSAKRWDNQNQLLRSMKIMLVQIEVKDHRSLEDHEIEYTAKDMQAKAKDLWNTIIQEEVPDLRLADQKYAYNILLEYAQGLLNNNISTQYHNESLKSSEKIIQETLKKRNFMVLNKIKISLEQSSINKDKIANIMSDIQQQFEMQIQQYQICFEKCSECFLFCKLSKNHIQRDQIQLKEDLFLKVTNLQSQIEILQKQILKEIYLEEELEKVEQLQLEQQSIRQQILLKQEIFQRDQVINDLKQLLDKNEYNDNLFACYMNEFLQNAFRIQQNDEDPLIRLQQIKESIENQIQILENDIKINQERATQINYEVKQINLEELNNCYNILESQQCQFNLEIQQDQQILNQYILNQEQQQQQIDGKIESIQEILNKYIDQDITTLKSNFQNQASLVQEKVDLIAVKIYELKSSLKLETDQQDMIQFLNQRIQDNNCQLEVLVMDINFQQNEYDSCLKMLESYQQYQQNTYYQKLFEKTQLKIEELNSQIKEQLKLIQIIKDQQQEYRSIFTKVNLQLDTSSQDDLLFEIIQIQNKDLFIQQQNLLNSQKNIIIANSELEEISLYNQSLYQQQYLQNKIEDLKRGINEKQNQYLDSNQNITRIQENILKQKDILQKLQQQQVDLQTDLDNQNTNLIEIQNNLSIFLQNKDKFDKINLYRENITRINDQIQKQFQNLSNKRAFEEITLELLQVQEQSISQEIIQIKELINITKQLSQLKLEQDQNNQELKNIQNYLSKQHNCGREYHYCDQNCQGCKEEINPCKYQAGHNIVNYGHLCIKEKHFCIKACHIKNCGRRCQQQYNHDAFLQHNCLENHECLEKCAYCPNICKLSNDNHEIHQCEKVQCSFQCYFNQNSFNDEKRCMNQCSQLHKDKHDYHICSNQAHQCFMSCQLPGTCQIATYTEKLKTWTTQNGLQFQYKMYKQNAERLQCQEKLMQKQIKHDVQHHCNQEHICDKRCPECDAFCTRNIGHQGKHQPHLHRNKEQQVFTFLQNSIRHQLFIQEEGIEDRIYQAGDSCEPETCTASCARRSRAHFHLLECKGNDQCAEIKLNYFGKRVAQHQKQKYKGSDKIYDEILCETYWDILGWEHPVENKQRKEINLCNFYCNACIVKDKYFCTKEAWHTNSNEYRDHSFSCQDSHKIQGVDIAFVLDSTGSMTPYIEIALETIIRLMDATKKYFKQQGKDKKGLKFSIVSYKDHDYPNVVEHIDFCKYSKAIDFLKQIQIIGGNDVPEAMFDGLQTATKLQWRPNSKKFLVLLCDSPPHGTPKYQQKYHDNHPQGCPCGYNEENTLPKISGMNIQMIALKLDQLLNQTFASFKKTMPQMIVYDEITNEQFVQKIENLVCQQLEIREITMSRQ